MNGAGERPLVDKIPVQTISTTANNSEAGFQIRPNRRCQVVPNKTRLMTHQMISILMAVQSGRVEKPASAAGRAISVSTPTAVSNRSRLIATASIDGSSYGVPSDPFASLDAVFIDFPPAQSGTIVSSHRRPQAL